VIFVVVVVCLVDVDGMVLVAACFSSMVFNSLW